MAYFNRLVFKPKVGDNADAKRLDAAMMGYDYFWNGAHAYRIGSQTVVHFIFGRCFKRRSLNTHIDTVNHAYAFFGSNGIRLCNESVVVRFMHIGETRPCRKVLSVQRVFWEEIDVVSNDHQVSYLEFGIHSARSIGHEKCLDAQFVHDANGECNFLHRIAFVEVEASLHRHDVNASEFAEDKFSAVPLYRGDGKVGNVGIRNFVTVSYF